MKKILLFIILSVLIACSRSSEDNPQQNSTPTNIEQTFQNLGINWNQTYNWKEYKMQGSSSAPYNLTGEKGIIVFIKPNIIKEVYNGKTYQTTFNASNFSTDGCDFSTVDWHNKPDSYFINYVESIRKYTGGEIAHIRSTNHNGYYESQKLVIY